MEDKILQLMSLCLKVNRATDADVFFNLQGHVNGISVQVYETGYEEGKEYDYNKRFYMDMDTTMSTTVDEMLEYMKGLS